MPELLGKYELLGKAACCCGLNTLRLACEPRVNDKKKISRNVAVCALNDRIRRESKQGRMATPNGI